jgi:hypothetical protein
MRVKTGLIRRDGESDLADRVDERIGLFASSELGGVLLYPDRERNDHSIPRLA